MPRHNNSPWTTSDLSQWSALCADRYLFMAPAGTQLFEQMQIHEYIYLVRQGRVAISVLSLDGLEQPLMFSAAGSLFGESCLYEGGKQVYQAVATTDTVLYRIPAEEFKSLLERSNELAVATAKDFYKKSALYMCQCISFTLSDIPRRLICTLIFIADMYGVQTPEGVLINTHFTQQELAGLANTSRVTVNRIMRQMVREGLIKKENGLYTITDISKLQDRSLFI